MSDAAEKVDDEIADLIVDEKAKPDEPTIEEIAAEQGHKSKEDWIAGGGDPKEWRSAEVFIARGEWIEEHKVQTKRIDDIESNFNTRLDNVNKLHQQQLDTQKAELIRKRDAAIDLADRETATSYQDDIDKLNVQPVDTSVSPDQVALDAWNTANPWILGTEPKAAYAKQQFALYQQQGQTVKQSIANAEADVARAFPEVNQNRETHPTTEGGSRPGKKRGAKKLAMSDLTGEELKYYRAMPNAWESEAAYLQAVQDTRAES